MPKLSGKIQQPSYHQPTSTPYLEASFFSPTEGMDQETCNIFNEHFEKMRGQFESRLQTLNAINQELAWKVALIDESKKVSDMTTEELVELTFAKQPDHQLLWLQLKCKFTQQDLEQIAEDEFAELINVITEKEIVTQVQKITRESEFQIRDAKEKMAKEFNLLRLQLLDRNEEIDSLKKSKL